MNIKKLLGEKIKRIRKSRGFTQEQLAEIIEISPRNMSRIEVGDCFVSSETLEKIINALNITAETLFSYEHLRENKELLADIYTFIDKIKNNREKLEKTYQLLKIIINDDI